jgi:phytoene desaturase
VYALLPYTEIAEGLWHPRGGMYRIVAALLEVLERDGVEVRTETEVTRIEHRGGRATGVALADGGHLDGDIVVCNADLPWAYEHLLDASVRAPYDGRRVERLRYGSSTLMLYLGMRAVAPELLHHNVYIGADPTAHFDDIFRPANRHRSLPNLYFVGASTQPGGGVPMVLLGARLVAERVAAEVGDGR